MLSKAFFHMRIQENEFVSDKFFSYKIRISIVN